MVLRLLIGLGCLLPLRAVEPEPAPIPPDPAQIVRASVDALQACDLVGWLERLPTTQRHDLAAVWDDFRQTPFKPARLGSSTMLLTMLSAPDAARHLMALIEPELAALQGAELTLLIEHWGRWLQNVRNGLPPCMTRDNLDVVLALLPELRAWSEREQLADPERVRRALELATGWLREQEIRTAQQVLALDLAQLAARAGSGLETLKQIFTLYGIDCDSFLSSITVTSRGEGAERTLTISFEVLGERRSIDRRVERDGDGWLPVVEVEELAALEDEATPVVKHD